MQTIKTTKLAKTTSSSNLNTNNDLPLSKRNSKRNDTKRAQWINEKYSQYYVSFKENIDYCKTRVTGINNMF